jgi:inner membrane protein
LDTLTHALSGALLGRALTPSRPATSARLQRWFGPPVPVWQGVTLGFAAAAFPDSDFVLRFVSDLAYLRGHRGVTHSLVMLPFWALLLGWLASLAFGRRDALRRYVLLAAAAIAIHIAGDWITQFGTMLLAPLSDARFGLGSVFIIDLVFSGIIVAGLLASAAVRRSRVPAMAALALLPCWVGLTVVGRSEALAFAHDYAARQGIQARIIDAAPRPASPFNWSVFVFDGTRYHVAHVNTRRSAPLLVTPDDHFVRRFSAPYQPLSLAHWESYEKFGVDAPALAREVWEHPQFGFFRWFAMYPLVYRVETRGAGANAETCVWYRDLRFGFPGRTSVPFRFGMCRAGPGREWALFALDDIAGRAALR